MTAGGHLSRVPAPPAVRASVEPRASRMLGRPAAPKDSGLRRQNLTMPPQPESVPAARHFLRMVLREWGLDAASDTVELAASEILTNAVLHARTSFEVTVVADDGLTVSVRDTGDAFPAHLTSEQEGVDAPAWDREGGRGLMIVAAVADDWGTTRNGSSTTVWFQVRLPQS